MMIMIEVISTLRINVLVYTVKKSSRSVSVRHCVEDTAGGIS